MTFEEIEDANAVWEILRDALLTARVVSIGPRPVAGEPELRVTLPGGRELTLVPQGESVPSFGTVLDVGGNRLRVWVSGVTGPDGVWMPVPQDAPAWLAEKGRDFRVSGDLRSLETATYSLHEADKLPPPLPDLTDAEADAFIAAVDQARQQAVCRCCVNNECECEGKDIAWNRGDAP